MIIHRINFKEYLIGCLIMHTRDWKPICDVYFTQHTVTPVLNLKPCLKSKSPSRLKNIFVLSLALPFCWGLSTHEVRNFQILKERFTIFVIKFKEHCQTSLSSLLSHIESFPSSRILLLHICIKHIIFML